MAGPGSRGNKKREGNTTDQREIKGILCQRVKSVAGYHNIIVTYLVPRYG